MSTMDPLTVLLVSDDEVLVRQLTDRWQEERVVPAFVVAADADALHSSFDLALVSCALTGATTHPGAAALAGLAGQVSAALSVLDKASRPTLVVADCPDSRAAVRRQFPRALVLSQHEGWPDTVVTIATEVLRRVEAVRRAERAEQLNLCLKRNATLGQYVLDMRHSLNNALTSVLGNAELLLLEPGTFSAAAHSQLDTIRHMALRMHEVLQRFSSLEKELSFAERPALPEGSLRSFLAAAP